MHLLSVAIQNWNPHCLAARALSNISCEQFVCSSCCCFGLLLSLFLSVSVHNILCKTYKVYQVYFLVQCSLANNLSSVTSIALHAFHGFVFIHTPKGISAFPTTVFFFCRFLRGAGSSVHRLAPTDDRRLCKLKSGAWFTVINILPSIVRVIIEQTSVNRWIQTPLFTLLR